MKILHIEYNNGTSESIENVHCVIAHDDDEISYFIGTGLVIPPKNRCVHK